MINESDLSELRSAVLTGVTIGVGSQIFIFENGVTLLIQCPFKRVGKGVARWGHGEEAATSLLIFDFLNHEVVSATFAVQGILVLDFGWLGTLEVVPESNGFESYVLITRFGMSPVLVF
ncbi:hypothetical protein [Pseudomonas sp. R3-18-08]|uniref:hypothetical protein n=1 Tax=Pseudomonas sp. R3-18-08 TaxID=1173283 RepID=UPI000F55D01D|nr:hypothetical protein [Pseudomonas sp. R3-18-08]